MEPQFVVSNEYIITCKQSHYINRSTFLTGKVLKYVSPYLYIIAQSHTNQILGNIQACSNRNPDQIQNLISDCVPPFHVQIYTDSTIGKAAVLAQRGVCLEYEQRPC